MVSPISNTMLKFHDTWIKKVFIIREIYYSIQNDWKKWEVTAVVFEKITIYLFGEVQS